MKVIREERTNINNNESLVKKGVYQESDGSYSWLTYTRTGTCKKLETAMRKAGF